MRVMVIGASTDRSKFGNKAVRAYLRQGHEVFAVNPRCEEVEGLPCYADVSAVPGPVDRATVYVPPQAGLTVIQALAQRDDVNEVWLNPGSESPELVAEAEKLGLTVIQACSIVNIGQSPAAL